MHHEQIEQLRNSLQRMANRYAELASQLDEGIGIPLNRDDKQLIRMAVMREIMDDINLTMTEWAAIGGKLPVIQLPEHYKQLG